MRLFFTVCCILYSFCAIFVNAFGIASPEIREFLGTTETQQGLIVSFQSIGGLLSAIFLALYGERFNKIRTISLGMGAMAVSMVAVGLLPRLFPGASGSFAAYAFLFAVLALGGVGNATIDLTMNSMVGEVFSGSKGVRIPVIHTFYGAGSMLVPFAFMLIFPLWSGAPAFTTPYLLLGVLSLVILVIYGICGKKVIPHSPYADMEKQRRNACANPAEVFRSAYAWILMLIAFLYTAFQLGLSAWLSTYNIQQMGLSPTFSGYLVSAYFSVSLVMRLITPKLIDRLTPTGNYALFGIASAASFVVAMVSGNSTVFILFLLLGGFLQGGLVPSFMIIASNAFPERQSSAASFFLISLSIAGLIVPALMGMMIEVVSFRFAMLFVVVCLFLSALVLWLKNRPAKV